MKIQSISAINYKNYDPNFEAKLPKRSFVRPKQVKKIFAYRDFAQYKPLRFNFEDYSIPVHNEAIGRKLKRTYSSQDFTELFNFAKSKGTFDYSLNLETGFVKTSQINRKENELMSDLIWTTDTCHNMTLVKEKSPELCTKVFNSLTNFYEKQQKNLDYAINNPKAYAQNPIWGTNVGVAHAFVPKTQLGHHWFAYTRLESVGLYLQTATDLIETGLNGGKYGYKTANEIPENVLQTLTSLLKYLKSINYPTARSCGAWEEQTFVNSLTSDTSVINEGMRKILNLITEPTQNSEIQNFRNRLMQTKHADILNDTNELYKLLKKGEKRVSSVHYTETLAKNPDIKLKPYEMKAAGRKSDSAMAFVAQTETIYPDSPLKDKIAKIGLLRQLEKDLVRDNGALRYKNDEYLNLDYHTISDKWGQNKKTNEAEWFLVSEIAKGYGKIVSDMLKQMETGKLNSQEQKLFDFALKKETEFVNRSYARITPRNVTKSNFYTCPGYKVPEAYEAVTTKKGNIKYVPGAHTPLTWAEASLFEASNQFLNNLTKLENINKI